MFLNCNNKTKTLKKTIYINYKEFLFIKNFCKKNNISISHLINILLINFINKIQNKRGLYNDFI